MLEISGLGDKGAAIYDTETMIPPSIDPRSAISLAEPRENGYVHAY
jgi:hypothetical protein